MPAADGLESERQESRSVCSKNIHHQSDLILRQLLTDFISVLKSVLFYSVQHCYNYHRQRWRLLQLLTNVLSQQLASDCLTARLLIVMN